MLLRTMPEHPTNAAVVAGHLREMILRGRVAPGGRLAQERIARECGVSQAVVREAFRDLVAEGLLGAEPRRGVRVLPLDPAEAEEITALRQAVETQLLAWAVPRLTRKDIAEAGAVLEALERAGSVDRIVALNRRFHELLYAPSGRARSLALAESLRLQFERYLRFTWQATQHRPRSQSQHRQLLRLIAAGRVPEACAALRAHIGETGEVIVAALRARAPTVQAP